MGIGYTISKSKWQKKGVGGTFKCMFINNLNGSAQVAMKWIRDEKTGEILKPPKLLPSQLKRAEEAKPREEQTPEGEVAQSVGLDRPELAWMETLQHLHGAAEPVPTVEPEGSSFELEMPVDEKIIILDGSTPQAAHLMPGNRVMTKRPWRKARGDADSMERQAAHWLRGYDHALACLFDEPEFTLLKVVCNLRNYFGMSLDQTVMLIRSLFNPKSVIRWSREGITLAWELVADYTPWLGLNDPLAIAEQKRIELEDEVAELLAYTREGGRVTTEDFYMMLKEWCPDLEATKTAVSRAVHAITGIETKSYREGRCYQGFHLPTADELLDPQQRDGLGYSAFEVPLRPVQVMPVLPFMPLVNACPHAS